MLYKWLTEEDESGIQHYPWDLPCDGQPGNWMPEIEGELIACERGYHLCRPRDLVFWINARLFAVETRGELIESDTKVVVRCARLLHEIANWNKCTARIFACDCAEHVLYLYESWNPDDPRPRETIATCRRYADGKATDAELAAAGAAAWAAATAARDAAWAAAGAAARDAAWAAAGAAAWDAAGNAAGNAGDAARATAVAAGDAAWNATWAAAGDAAWAAARAARAVAEDAERAWQSQRLIELLGLDGSRK